VLECPSKPYWPLVLLFLTISATGDQQAFSQSPSQSEPNPWLAVEEAGPAKGGSHGVLASALQAYGGFRRIAESELRSQLPREKMLSLINRIESAARDAGMNDSELVALTQHGLTEGARQGLGPVLIFENIANALLRIQK
jgi:hypothetical protein